MNLSSPVTEDVLDHIRLTLKQEESSYAYRVCSNSPVDKYTCNLHNESCFDEDQMNPTWREKICQWSYNVVDQ